MKKKKDKVYQSLLVKLMQAKKKRLPLRLGRLYFNAKDRAELMRWSNSRAKSVWAQITYNCSKPDDFAGLSHKTCPFCIISDCYHCSYRKRHGECFSDSSDYRQILNTLGRYKEGFKDTKILPQSFYIKQIKALEKTYL